MVKLRFDTLVFGPNGGSFTCKTCNVVTTVRKATRLLIMGIQAEQRSGEPADHIVWRDAETRVITHRCGTKRQVWCPRCGPTTPRPQGRRTAALSQLICNQCGGPAEVRVEQPTVATAAQIPDLDLF